MTTEKRKNTLNNLLLNYASHLTVSCEYINPFSALPATPCNQKNLRSLNLVNGRPESHGYGQRGIINGLGHLTLIINRLLSHKAKLLVVNCAERSHLGGRPSKSKDKDNPFLFTMDHGWINGTCSNWSRLCQVAWNSHSVSTASRLQSGKGGLEGWVRQAESVYKGLYLQANAEKPAKHMLAFKRKPDCIFLINPTMSVVRECKSLNIPLCLLSTTFPFKAANCSLSSNHESYYLIYLINCIISYYKGLPSDPSPMDANALLPTLPSTLYQHTQAKGYNPRHHSGDKSLNPRHRSEAKGFNPSHNAKSHRQVERIAPRGVMR